MQKTKIVSDIEKRSNQMNQSQSKTYKIANRVFRRNILCKRKSFIHMNCKIIYMSNRIFSTFKKDDSLRETARIN